MGVDDERGERATGRRLGGHFPGKGEHVLVAAVPLLAQVLQHRGVRPLVPRMLRHRTGEPALDLGPVKLAASAGDDQEAPRGGIRRVALDHRVQAVLGHLEPPEELPELLLGGLVRAGRTAGLPGPGDAVRAAHEQRQGGVRLGRDPLLDPVLDAFHLCAHTEVEGPVVGVGDSRRKSPAASSYAV